MFHGSGSYCMEAVSFRIFFSPVPFYQLLLFSLCFLFAILITLQCKWIAEISSLKLHVRLANLQSEAFFGQSWDSVTSQHHFKGLYTREHIKIQNVQMRKARIATLHICHNIYLQQKCRKQNLDLDKIRNVPACDSLRHFHRR